MKIIRYVDTSGSTRYGALSADGSARLLEGDPFTGPKETGEPAAIQRTLSPVAPTALLCIGLNYRHHAEESGAKIPEFPILFTKPPGAAVGHGEAILIPTRAGSTEVDYEAELAVVIGKPCKNVRADEALQYVLGYTCANDVSARDWQLRWGGSQWCRGKGFDTFAPLGPCLVTTDEIPDPNTLRIRCEVNGETLQDWTTGDMIFNVPALIAFLSQSTTLLPGTTILTGTPHGVGMARKPPLWLRVGDSVTIEIERIGRLTNPVAAEA